jgi:hypothetical protein
MKIIPQAQVMTLSYKDAMAHILMIYNEPTTGFDEDCVDKYEIIMDEYHRYTVTAYYSYVKVTPKDAPTIYWPIQPYKEEFSEEASKKIIKELAKCT